MSRHLVFILAIALAAFVAVPAASQVQTLTQNADGATIAPGGSLACLLGTTTDNGWLRSFPLSGLPGPIEVVSITFGVQDISHANYPLTIRLFTDPTPAAIAPYAGLTLIHTEQVVITAAPLSVVTVPMTGVPVIVAPTATLVVEVFHQGGSGVFILGSNASGETAPGYLMAPPCGVSEPSSLASLGAPNAHVLISVGYVPAGTPKPYAGTHEDLTLWSRVGANPLTTGLGHEVKAAAGGSFITLRATSPGGTFHNRDFLVLVEPFVTGNPPFPAIAPGVNMTIGGVIFLAGGLPGPLGGLLLPPEGFWITLQVPPALAGVSALFQGVIVWPGGPANGLYASTDGHEFQFS